MTEHAHGAPGDPDRHDQAVGSLGQEAARLAEAVQEWLTGLGGGRDDGVPGAWADATAHQTESPECRVCPVCQALRLLRGTRPEAFGHLADAAASLSAALRAMVPEPEGGPAAPGRPGRAGVERIDLGN